MKHTTRLILLIIFVALLFIFASRTVSAAGAALAQPLGLDLEGNYAYIVSDSDHALEIIDISNPEAPLHTSTVFSGEGGGSGALLNRPFDVTVSNNTAYVVSPNVGFVEILDVSDPVNPIHKTAILSGNPSVMGVVVHNNFLYAIARGNGSVNIYDVSDPASPVLTGSIFTNWPIRPTSAFISESYLYVAYWYEGTSGGEMRVYDISDPSNPVFQGVIHHGTDGASINNPISIVVSGNYAYIVTARDNSLEIIDVSDPTNPTHAGKIYDGEGGAKLLSPQSIQVSGNYAYVASFAGHALEVVDISDPTNPTHAGYYYYPAEASSPFSVEVRDSLAYVTLNAERALDIIDVSSPANPRLVSRIKNGELVGSYPASNVLFLPGIKGSVLATGTDTLWPPSGGFSNDVAQLALDDSGDSVNGIHTTGILNDFHGTNIYQPFTDFMDSLEGNLINEWMPLAYDWRFSPERVIQDGIKTEAGVKNVITEIEGLASRAKNGKVAIVAHSMGGLLGKAIIKELENQGKANLIESFTMVGTPQLGTPQAIASLLHGDQEAILGAFITNPKEMRALARNLQSAHDLLPSEKYFEEVVDPVITFDSNKSFTETWRNIWGEFINSYNAMAAFLTGVDGRSRPDPSALSIPEVLRSELVVEAQDFHNIYDNYEIPSHVRVVQVAGWGLPTTKAVNHTSKHFFQNFGYETMPTSEGDKTVVYPSAISSNTDETYFFNLDLFRDPSNKMAQHRDLLSTNPIQSLIRSTIKQEVISTNNLLTTIKPQVTSIEHKLLIETNSPVILGAYDQAGNLTGIDPNQDLSQEILAIKEEIPGSTFSYTADGQSIFLPKDGIYNFIYKGTGEGPTTVEIQSFIADTVSPIVTFTDIPTTPMTEASFTVESNTPEDTGIEVDTNGDGVIDITFRPDGETPTPLYEFSGFLQPINDPEIYPGQALSVFKKGSTVPVKFQLKDSQGNIIQAESAPIWLAPERGDRMNASIVEESITTPATSGNTYRWDPESQQYIFNWSTKGLSAGYWYKIFAKLDDGITYSVVVGLR